MNRIVLLAAVAGAICGTLSAKTAADKPKSARDIVKSYNKGFPYETRVDRSTIPGKAIHWYSDGHSVTVTPHRVNCVYLTNTVDSAVLTAKRVKAAQKAARKDAKNLDKAVKELEKLKKKSSADFALLYDEAIRIFEGAKEDN